MITNEMIEAAKGIAAQITKAMDGVTDGPWEVYEGCSWRRIGTKGPGYNDCAVLAPTVASDGHPDLTCHRGNDLHANLDYIALCNPANMRVLLSALDAIALLPGEPVAWLRHGENVPVQGIPLGAMWITDKDDLQGFPVYAASALLPVAVKTPEDALAIDLASIKASEGNVDDADPRTVLLAILGCAESWVSDARIIGNVRAIDISRAIRSALSPVGGTEARAATVEDHNYAFDPADEAFGGAFRDGFREGWLFCRTADGEDYDECVDAYGGSVDMAPTECWDAYRSIYFAKLPLAAIPEVGSVISPTPASEIAALREALKSAEEALFWAARQHHEFGNTRAQKATELSAHAARSALQHVAKGERGQ